MSMSRTTMGLDPGLSDYLLVITALQGLQRSQINLLQAQRQMLSYRVQLCRALGGAWTSELDPPESGGSR